MIRMLSSRLITICAIALIIEGTATQVVDAQELDPTITYLISAPMTLMDKGIFEIQSSFKDANANAFWLRRKPSELSGMGVVSSVYVLPNRISVHVQVYPEVVADSKRACHALIRYAEDVLGFQPEGGRPQYMPESLSKIFGHYAYTPKGHPANLGNRLLGLFAMQGNVIPNKGEKGFCHSIGGGPIQNGQLR